MEQRISLVTLGVRDLASSREFYEALGWTTGAGPEDDVVFFRSGGMVLALWDRERLAEDSGVEDGGGWGGVTLAHNVRSPEEVDAVVEEARRAGADIVREPAETFWGGYSAAFHGPGRPPLGDRPQPALDDQGRRLGGAAHVTRSLALSAAALGIALLAPQAAMACSCAPLDVRGSSRLRTAPSWAVWRPFAWWTRPPRASRSARVTRSTTSIACGASTTVARASSAAGGSGSGASATEPHAASRPGEASCTASSSSAATAAGTRTCA
jgi:uncharacterized protein